MIYLGTLGRMIGVKCPASQQVTNADRYSFETTLEGRVKAQTRPIGRRAWQAELSAASSPGEISTLLGFVEGEWGAGPFYFVPAEAPITNLLTPSASLCLEVSRDNNVVPGGPVDLGAEGVAGASYSQISTAGDGIFLGASVVPVLPGRTVTGAAWIRGGGGTVRLFWYDAAGTFMSSSVSVPVGGSNMVRAAVSAAPPPGAVGCRLAAVGVIQASRPSVTWSDQVLPWSIGKGCNKAVIHAPAENLTIAAPGAVYSGLSFTITEVG